jgi:hypothetical protein
MRHKPDMSGFFLVPAFRLEGSYRHLMKGLGFGPNQQYTLRTVWEFDHTLGSRLILIVAFFANGPGGSARWASCHLLGLLGLSG